MSIEIWLAIIAIVATPVAGWIGAVLMRQKYKAEIESLKADINKKITEVRSNELDNVREGNDILMTQIVEPLKSEIKSLRTDVNKFRRAIEKALSCPHVDSCPVRYELQDKQEDDKSGHGFKK